MATALCWFCIVRSKQGWGSPSYLHWGRGQGSIHKLLISSTLIKPSTEIPPSRWQPKNLSQKIDCLSDYRSSSSRYRAYRSSGPGSDIDADLDNMRLQAWSVVLGSVPMQGEASIECTLYETGGLGQSPVPLLLVCTICMYSISSGPTCIDTNHPNLWASTQPH